MVRPVIWHGNERQAIELEEILRINCTCTQTDSGRVLCAGHDAFVHSQQFGDSLLCERARRDQLLLQEFAETSSLG